MRLLPNGVSGKSVRSILCSERSAGNIRVQYSIFLSLGIFLSVLIFSISPVSAQNESKNPEQQNPTSSTNSETSVITVTDVNVTDVNVTEKDGNLSGTFSIQGGKMGQPNGIVYGVMVLSPDNRLLHVASLGQETSVAEGESKTLAFEYRVPDFVQGQAKVVLRIETSSGLPLKAQVLLVKDFGGAANATIACSEIENGFACTSPTDQVVSVEYYSGSFLVAEPVRKAELSLTANVAAEAKPSLKPGRYVVLVKGGDGVILATTFFQVAGSFGEVQNVTLATDSQGRLVGTVVAAAQPTEGAQVSMELRSESGEVCGQGTAPLKNQVALVVFSEARCFSGIVKTMLTTTDKTELASLSQAFRVAEISMRNASPEKQKSTLFIDNWQTWLMWTGLIIVLALTALWRGRSLLKKADRTIVKAFSFGIIGFLSLILPHLAHAGSQSYTTQGSYLFTVPAGVTQITVTGSGGGGGGANATGFCPIRAGGGGGSGAAVSGRVIAVTPGSSIPVTIGGGGTGGQAESTSLGGLLTLPGGWGASSSAGASSGGAGGNNGAPGWVENCFGFQPYLAGGGNGGDNVAGGRGGNQGSISTYVMGECLVDPGEPGWRGGGGAGGSACYQDGRMYVGPPGQGGDGFLEISWVDGATPCSFNGTVNWGAGTNVFPGSECTGNINVSGVTVGESRTVTDSDGSGTGYTGSINFRCDNGPSGWTFTGSSCVRPPTVTLGAFSPSTITVGSSSNITLATTDATSCVGDPGSFWVGPIATSYPAPGASTGPIATPGTYTQRVTCTGPGGNATSTTSTLTVNPGVVSGTCGPMDGQTYPVGASPTPGAGAGCSSGTYSSGCGVDGCPWYTTTTFDANNIGTNTGGAEAAYYLGRFWTCAGSGGGTSRGCTDYFQPQCGSANGTTRTTPPPASNALEKIALCQIGTASTVTTGAGSYTWSCTNGAGPTANCSANRSGGGPTGSITARVIVAHEDKSPWKKFISFLTGRDHVLEATGSPAIISTTGRAAIDWNSSGASACQVTNPSMPMALSLSGTREFTGAALGVGDHDYTLSCDGGAVTDSARITVTAPGCCGTGGGSDDVPSLSASPGTCGTGVINLSWGAIAGATSYQLRDGATVIYDGAGTSFVHTGLVAGSSHNYTVRSTGPSGSSNYSSVVNENAPANCVAVCGNNVVEAPEQCDTGAARGACPATCSNTCTNNVCGPGVVNGVCAVPPQGGSYASVPPAPYCSSGTPTAVTSGGGFWTWNCNGSGGGSNASCWAIDTSVPSVNGVCNATHNNCLVGTSANPTEDASYWRWDCLGSGGGSTASCIEPKAPVVPVCGNNVTEFPEQCDTGAARGVCPATCNATCQQNDCGPPQCDLTHYNCTIGTPWGMADMGTYWRWWCTAPGYTDASCMEVKVAPGVTGNITSFTDPCIIPAGQSTCSTTVNWSTSYSDAAPNSVYVGVVNSTGTLSQSFGFPTTTTSYTWPLGTYPMGPPDTWRVQLTAGASYGGALLDEKSFVVRCAPGTNWVSGLGCQSVPTVTLRINGSAGPLTVAPGDSLSITWTVSGATSCTASGKWSGSKSITGATEPATAAIPSGDYILSCSNAAGTTERRVTVNVACAAGVGPWSACGPPCAGGNGTRSRDVTTAACVVTTETESCTTTICRDLNWKEVGQ